MAAEPWRRSGERAARRLALMTLAGAACGLVVAGVGSRLAMAALAGLNPEATGRQSDDDFTMGQFTASGTINLLIVTTGLGVAGAAFYALVRGLRTGHAWFDLPALALGPGVVAGAAIVHTDGVDFTLLDPVALAIALFVLVPAAYCLAITLLAERLLLAEERWAARARLRSLAPLALWIPLAPVLAVVCLFWAAREGIARTWWGAAAIGHPARISIARGALVVIFGLSVADLCHDAGTVTGK